MQTCSSSSFGNVTSTITIKLKLKSSPDQLPILLELWPPQCYIDQHSFLKITWQGKIKCWRNKTILLQHIIIIILGQVASSYVNKCWILVYMYFKLAWHMASIKTCLLSYLAYSYMYLYLLKVSLTFTIPIVVLNWAAVIELFIDVTFTENINYHIKL